MDRRSFLIATGGAAAGLAVAHQNPAFAFVPRAGRPFQAPADTPFTLGVSSGDPDHQSVVLWTRLAPDPLVPGGGMAPERVPLDWEVASDEDFRRVVRRGRAHVVPEDAHTAHVVVDDLRPGATYWYRFRAGGEISPVGRTRTTPSPGARPGRVRFATASCHNFQDGYYTAYQAMTAEDLDFVVFLGDYIYEGAPNPNALRQHDGTGEPYTVDQYRARHARYRSDPDLQACHAAFPWIVTLDDHEIDNNWADEIPQDPAQQPHDQWLARRTAAFKAYYEHMPLRRRSIPDGIDMLVYRRFLWADLLQLDVLDTRQYRTDQPTTLEGANDPAGTMLGSAQAAWLFQGLRRSRTRWNALAQQTMMAQNDRTAGPVESYSFDNWDGYRVERQRVLDELQGVDNPVVLTGDRHATWVCDLKDDFDDPTSATVAAELTGTSISSGGDSNHESFHETYDPIMAESPHWKFIDNHRGYLLCDVDRQRWLTDMRVVSTVRAPEASVSTLARVVTEAGQRGVALA